MDFSNFPLSNRYYGGTEKKLGILIDDQPYMLKFQKRTAFGMRFNHISEHIGSQVFSLLGLSAQETVLGTYDGQQVVACKDFVGLDEQFVPFNDVGESTLDQDKETYQYEYVDIMRMLEDNTKLTNVQETISLFWQTYVIDALLGNFDRHGANWGFIKKNNVYRVAPIFDNGSCLFPGLPDDQAKMVVESKEETNKRVFTFPTSQIKIGGKKSSYYEVIHSLAFPECNKALAAIVGRIEVGRLHEVVSTAPFVSEERKRFLIHMLDARYEKILKDSYDRLMEGR